MDNIIKIKAILSSTLLVSFLVLVVTGIGLYLSPSGKIAKETNWRFLSANKSQLEKIHTIFGFVFAGLVFFHWLANRKLLQVELQSFLGKNKREN